MANVGRLGIPALSEHTQARDFENERFLRRSIQVIAQFLESPKPFQHLSRRHSLRDFCGCLLTFSQIVTASADLRS